MNAEPVFVVAMNTGAVTLGVVLSKIMAPPAPVIAVTSNVQTGVVVNAFGNVNVSLGAEPNEAEPDVIVNLQVCEYPANDPTEALVPHPDPRATLAAAHAVPVTDWKLIALASPDLSSRPR